MDTGTAIADDSFPYGVVGWHQLMSGRTFTSKIPLKMQLLRVTG